MGPIEKEKSDFNEYVKYERPLEKTVKIDSG